MRLDQLLVTEEIDFCGLTLGEWVIPEAAKLNCHGSLYQKLAVGAARYKFVIFWRKLADFRVNFVDWKSTGNWCFQAWLLREGVHVEESRGPEVGLVFFPIFLDVSLRVYLIVNLF